MFSDRIGELFVYLIELEPLNYVISDSMHPFSVSTVLDVVIVGLVDEWGKTQFVPLLIIFLS